MFDAIKNDPAIIEITIVFIILVGIALWQKLYRTALIMGLIYVLYLIFIVFNASPSNKQELHDASKGEIPDNETAIDLAPKVVEETEKSEINMVETIIDEQEKIIIVDKKKLIPENIKPDKIELTVNKDSHPIDIKQENPIKVVSSQIGRDLFNRQLVSPDSIFNLDDKRIYCWTKIQNQNYTKTIFHKWYHKGKLHARIKMDIGLSYNWRSWSYITVSKERVGDWKVVVEDTLGIRYDSLLFRIENNIIE
ncbi:MAG: DUF2914 domain-containing protein [Candidatus Marinimicrobia bacterium]|jgi:hypothetical protein|nr:DUF2914 domain-containing protein [Candidatus Neomarinimicrobiota bacterium]MDP6611060.1 DUF2914 domain-containing protein [Candidatus Neomarinimicrobiota bacterium]|tara:strand:+ start:34699 stop:35451 length:753 start_codon:yes stop_codon:yes gene_type:complete